MKVVRLKRGYHINLSDSEMDLINILISEGLGSFLSDFDRSHWSRGVKAAYTRLQNQGKIAFGLVADIDKREK